MFERRVGVVDVVAVALARQGGVQTVVEVVVPLRRVATDAILGVAPEERRRVVVVLKDQVDLPAAGTTTSDCCRQLVEKMRRRIVADRMHRIQRNPSK